MRVDFYDLTKKKKIKAEVTGRKKVKNPTGTSYMLLGKTSDGRKLTRFTNKETYNSVTV